MKYLIAIAFLAFTINSSAQITFEKSWGGNGYQDGQRMTQTSDGGFVIAGVSSTDTTSQLDIIIVKTDSLGDSLWTKQFGGPSANDFPSAIVETHDGGFLISATTYSLGSQAPTLSDWYIIRTDANGDTLWTKIIRNPNNDRTACIYENADHSILCSGWWSISGYAKGTLLKLSETGDSLWSTQIGSSGNSFAQTCLEGPNGNYLVGGARLSGTFGAIIMEYDTAGTFINYHEFNLPSIGEYINSIHPLPQGGYLLSAKAGASVNYDVWVLRTDDNFDTLWTHTYNDSISMSNQESVFAFSVKDDGGYIFGGTQFIASNMQAVIYNFDSSGTFLWQKHFSANGSSIANSLLSLQDGGFIFCGQTNLITNNTAELYLVRTNSDGDIILSNNNDIEERPITLYPNPASDYLRINFGNADQVTQIQITNHIGEIVYSELLSSDYELNEKLISLQDLNAGIYLIRIQSGRKTLAGKFVIIK